MKTFFVEPDSVRGWRVQPGCRILVMGSGAVRFDFPKDWIACVDTQYVRLVDREAPDGRCGLIVTWHHISLPMTAMPIVYLLRQVTAQESETRRIVQRFGIVPIFRCPLEAAWRQVQMKIGRAGVLPVNRQVGRHLMEQQGLVVRVKALVSAVVQRLRAVGGLVFRIPVAVNRHEALMVQADRVAARMSQTRPSCIDRCMHIHGVLQAMSDT